MELNCSVFLKSSYLAPMVEFHNLDVEIQKTKKQRFVHRFEARGVRHWGVLAKSAGALFIRSYERGERVHLAMVSRGYAGSMPVIDEVTASRTQWTHALALPLSAFVVCVLGWAL